MGKGKRIRKLKMLRKKINILCNAFKFDEARRLYKRETKNKKNEFIKEV